MRAHRFALWSAFAVLWSPSFAPGQTDLLPIGDGQAVATCFSGGFPNTYSPDPEGFVVAIINTSAGEQASAGTGLPSGVYPWQSFHNEEIVQNPNPPSAGEEWRAANLGEVFGITIDSASPPNIYVTATTCYGSFDGIFPAGEGPGSVYKLNGATGEISTFCQLANDPDEGPALGNICVHTDSGGNDWFYVSNFEDGLIYRRDAGGGATGTFDHGVDGVGGLPDDGTAGFTQLGRRVWGLEDYNSRLYYGVWRDSPVQMHQVWSVGLDGSGNFLPASELLEVTIPNHLPLDLWTRPVSDITFSQDGAMFLAERAHFNFALPPKYRWTGVHGSRIMEYVGGSGAWAPHPDNIYKLGWLANLAPLSDNKIYDNSAGGVAVECEGNLWVTCDATYYQTGSGTPKVYGLQRFPIGGNTAEYDSYCNADATDDMAFIANSHLVDIDGEILESDKSRLGDVEIFDPSCECMAITVAAIECPPSAETFSIELTVTNLSGGPISFVAFSSCDPAELPDGAVAALPGPATPIAVPGGLADGESTVVTVEIPAEHVGAKVCINVSLSVQPGETVCTKKICFNLPACGCYALLDYDVEKAHDEEGELKWIFTASVSNQSAFTLHYATVSDLRFAPNPVAFDPPVAPGHTGTITACITGAVPAEVLGFYLGVHAEDLVECCSERLEIKLPDCIDQKADYCELLPKIATCCPDPNVPGLWTAQMTLRICNNSSDSRSYDWDLADLPPSGACDGQVSAGAFFPNMGTVTVPPNSCLAIPITLRCPTTQNGLFDAGQCARYDVCVTQVDDPDNFFCCDGVVRRLLPGQIILKQIDPVDGGPVVVAPGKTGSGKFEATNTSAQPVTIRFGIRESIRLAQIRLPGGEAGDEVEGILSIPPGGTVPLDFEIIPRTDEGDGRVNTIELYLFDELTGSGSPTLYYSSPWIYLRSPFELIDISKSPNEVSIRFRSKDGRSYRLQENMDMLQPGAWRDTSFSLDRGGSLIDSTGGIGIPIDIFIPVDPGLPRLYFRGEEIP
ncbi:MAG: hypothetical protein ACI9TH_003163 [Kiritimatiellia bacterium]|jgi:hypothetical protein